MRLGKLMYTIDEKKSPSFKDLYFIRSDITFSEWDQYVTLRLKCGKIDTNHNGVLIMLAAVNNTTCPVLALRCNDVTRDQSHNTVSAISTHFHDISLLYSANLLNYHHI